MWDNNNNNNTKEKSIPFSEIKLLFDVDPITEDSTSKKVEWLLSLPSTKKVHPDEWKKIADYPHIAHEIERLSSNPYELVSYLQNLINPDYNLERRKFNIHNWKPVERVWFPISMLNELYDVFNDAFLKKEEADKRKWIVKRVDPWTINNNKVR